MPGAARSPPTVRPGAHIHPYRRLRSPSLAIAADDNYVKPHRLDALLRRPLPDLETMEVHVLFFPTVPSNAISCARRRMRGTRTIAR